MVIGHRTGCCLFKKEGRDVNYCHFPRDIHRGRGARQACGRWDGPNLYDVVLNLSRVSLGTACEIVTRLTEQDEFKATPESRRVMANLTLASRVSAKLAVDPRTRGVELEVVADDGIVTISGETRFQAVDEAIDEVARHVDGVTEVRSQVVFIPVYPAT